jgi:hypothetical protein
MEKLFTWEQWRLIFATTASPLLAYFTPTAGFMYALIIMFAFNIWAGMRADGVAIKNCKRFSFRKFKNALAELLLYVTIIHVIYSVMLQCGDNEAAMIVIKSLTYVFMYVYLQNAFRNLIVAYPKKIALRIIYHVIRLEFTRALPSYWQPIIERFQAETDGDIINNKKEGKE